MASRKLGDMPVGSIVKCNIADKNNNPIPWEFIVVHQGKPVEKDFIYSSTYNNGTILIFKNIESQLAFHYEWGTAKSNNFETASIMVYLNSTLLSRFEEPVRNSIKQVKVPYHRQLSSWQTIQGENGKPCKLWIPSEEELRTGSCHFDYFNNGTDQRRCAYFNTISLGYWTRTPPYGSTDDLRVINSNGVLRGNTVTDSNMGVRPVFVLPNTMFVRDDGALAVNSAPSAPTAITLPATIRGGQSFSISWSGASDRDGNLAGYYAERNINNSGIWTQMYQGGAASATDMLAFGTASKVQYRVKSYDAMNAQSGWYTSAAKDVINNRPPNTPGSITVPDGIAGGNKITISWAAATDPDNNLSGYRLERAVDSGGFGQIYQGPALSYADTITKGWKDVTYRVRAYDALNEVSGYTTSPKRTIDNNTAPAIHCSISGNIGAKDQGFTIPYSVNDAEGDPVTVRELIDGKQLRSFAAVLGTNYSVDITGLTFMKLLNGSHTIQIQATDSGNKSYTHTITFIKAVHSCRITLQEPLAADSAVSKLVMNITKSIPADAEFKVMVTNNARDGNPVWEDATAYTQTGLNYIFENKTAANGFAFNFIISAKRGESVAGGYVQAIGGAFE